MAASGTGNLVFIDSTMNKWVYLNILKNNLKQSAEKLGILSNFKFSLKCSCPNIKVANCIYKIVCFNNHTL